MVTVPTWAALAVSAGTPSLTFVGVLIAQYFMRLGANELELRARREETFRVLRWAAELAVSDDENGVRLGVSQLNALGDSQLLDEAQQLFVDAALVVVIDGPADDIDDDATIEMLPEFNGHSVPSIEDGEKGGDDG